MQFVTKNQAERSLNAGDRWEHDLVTLNTFDSPLTQQSNFSCIRAALVFKESGQMVKAGNKKGQCKNTLISDLLLSRRPQKKPAVPLCYIMFILIGKSFGTGRRLHFVPQRSKSILKAGAALKTSASPVFTDACRDHLCAKEGCSWQIKWISVG